MYGEDAHLLHEAATRGDLKRVTDLLAQGSDPDGDSEPFGDGHDETPLHAAAAGGHPEVVRALLAANANPDPRDWAGMTPLLKSLEGAHKDAGRSARLLIEAGADVSYCPPPDCVDEPGPALWTLLLGHLRYPSTRMSREALVELVELLLDCGSDPSQTGLKAWAPLHLLARLGTDEDATLVKLLCSRGADPHAVDDAGARPIEQAMSEVVYEALGGDAG